MLFGVTRSLSFRTRLIAGSALVSGIVLAVFIVATAYMVFDNLTEEADQELRDRSGAIFESARAGRFLTEARPFDDRATISAEDAELRLVRLTSPDGEIVFEDERWTGDRDVEMRTTAKGWTKTVREGGQRWRLLSRRSQDGWHMRLAIDLREVEDEVREMVRRYLRALPAALILIALGAWWLAERIVRPVRAVIAMAERITPEGLGERVEEVDSGDEIGRLTRVLNRMVARLEAAFQQTRRFSSDASHELRTPLTVMQGKIEAALQRPASEPQHAVLADLLEQVQGLKSIVDSLLMFSRSDTGNMRVPDDEVDLSALVDEVCEDGEWLADEAGVRFERDVTPGVKVRGDAHLLKLAAYNLVQNAVKFNLPAGGVVRCSLGPEATVAVENTGPPIASQDAEKIFERFYRADPSRSSPKGQGRAGYGLGLSLARIIAEAHGGSLTLASSRAGINRFELRLATTTTDALAGDTPHA